MHLRDGETEDEGLPAGRQGLNGDIEISSEEGGHAEALRALKEKLARCLLERQEYLDGWQRSRADFINARKDDEALRSKISETVRSDILGEVLPALDAVESAMRDAESWQKLPPAWQKGIEGIHAGLLAAFERSGASFFSNQGEPFDPSHHQSIGIEVVADRKLDGTITYVVQKGCSVGGKVIRPAQVRVGEYRKEERESTSE